MTTARRDQLSAWPTWALLPLASRLAEHLWARYLSKKGVTPAGYGILAELSSGPACQAELADHRRVGPQSLGRTVDRLERAGFVVRERDPSDRRQLLVRRTRNGDELVADVARHISQSEDALLDRLPHPDQFRTELLTVIAMLDGAPQPAAADPAFEIALVGRAARGQR